MVQRVAASRPLPASGTRRLTASEMSAVRALGFSCSAASLVYMDGSISTGQGRKHPGVLLHEQAAGTRRLQAGREVADLTESVSISLTTRCPGKWAMVDMETGELWGHDGMRFRRLSPAEAAEVAVVAKQAAG